MALNISSVRDTKWLTLEVCRQFQRGNCSRRDEECKFAHPPKSCQVENGRVIACFDSLKVRNIAYNNILDGLIRKKILPVCKDKANYEMRSFFHVVTCVLQVLCCVRCVSKSPSFHLFYNPFLLSFKDFCSFKTAQTGYVQYNNLVEQFNMVHDLVCHYLPSPIQRIYQGVSN